MRNKIPLTLILPLILLSLILPQILQAAEYYLDAVKGDDSNPGISEQPWKTLNRAYTWYSGTGPKVQEGDTVYFRNGDYGEFKESTRDNPPEKYHFHRTNWITYKADTGQSPQLSGITINNADHYSVPLYQPGESYLVFNGFTIPSGQASIQYTNYVKLLNCNISGPVFTISGGYLDWYIPANSLLVDLRGSSHILIDHCYLQKDFRAVQTGGDTERNNDVTVRNTTMTHLSGQGIMAGTDNLTVEDCLVEDIDTYRSDYPIFGTVSGMFTVGEEVVQDVSGARGIFKDQASDRIYIYQKSATIFDETHNVTGQTSGATVTNVTQVDPTHTNAIYIAGGNNVTIQRNILNTNTMNLCFYIYDAGAEVSGAYIANNLIYGHPDGAGGSNVHIEGVVGMTFVNNTIDPSGENMALRILHNTRTEITNFYNNTLPALYLDSDVEGLTTRIVNHGNNIFANNPNKPGGAYPFYVNATELVNTIPEFVDAANNDYRLAKGSVAIDFGDPAYAPATDILGKPRDAQPDAGCYEYGATPLKADLNRDGKVNIQDVQACVNHILGKQDWGTRADVNGDGIINEADIQEIIKIILER